MSYLLLQTPYRVLQVSAEMGFTVIQGAEDSAGTAPEFTICAALSLHPDIGHTPDMYYDGATCIKLFNCHNEQIAEKVIAEIAEAIRTAYRSPANMISVDLRAILQGGDGDATNTTPNGRNPRSIIVPLSAEEVPPTDQMMADDRNRGTGTPLQEALPGPTDRTFQQLEAQRQRQRLGVLEWAAGQVPPPLAPLPMLRRTPPIVSPPTTRSRMETIRANEQLDGR